MKTFIHTAFGLLAILSLISCASTTTIQALNSNGEPDQNVKIYVDGIYKGDGEIQYTDSKARSPFLNTTVVQLKKQKCQTRREELKTKISIPKFIGSMALAAGAGGLMGYWFYFSPIDSEIGTLVLIGAGFIAGMIPSLFVNNYKPLHSYDFQCVKVIEE